MHNVPFSFIICKKKIQQEYTLKLYFSYSSPKESATNKGDDYLLGNPVFKHFSPDIKYFGCIPTIFYTIDPMEEYDYQIMEIK